MKATRFTLKLYKNKEKCKSKDRNGTSLSLNHLLKEQICNTRGIVSFATPNKMSHFTKTINNNID